ncbi:MAG: OmpA family protein [bacterium]|nr:OmpA family protein [bacterium]
MMKKVLTVIAIGGLLAGCESTKKEVHDEGFVGGHRPTMKFQGPVPGSSEAFKAAVQDRIMFDFDKSAVSAEGSTVLDAQADWLKKYPSVDLLIEGHCDKTGTREYNLALGERRAVEIKRYLMSKDIEEHRLHIVSYGKERLQAEGDTKEAHQKNRVGVSVIQ